MTQSLYKKIGLLLLITFFTSCIQRKLNLKVIENDEIKIEHYYISEITFIHEFLDLTDKRWDKTERIYKGGTRAIDSVYIRNDTIYLTAKNNNLLIYDLSAIKFGYTIELLKN